MLSGLENHRLYVVGGLATLLFAFILNYISFVTFLCLLVITVCGAVTFKFVLNENRQQLGFLSSYWQLLRSKFTAAESGKESESHPNRQFRPESRSQLSSSSRTSVREGTMNTRQNTNGPADSRLSRSFGAVKSFLRSPQMVFGGKSSPLFSPKVGVNSSPLASPASLPKVHRIRDSFRQDGSSYQSRPIASAQRRYPTHQPQYSGLGMMPPVNFHRTERPILSERNTNMIHSPVTVKIAPPDVLKNPVPSLMPSPGPQPSPRTSSEILAHQPCDTATVISAIREKRKRNHRDESVVQSPEPSQESKRRRQTDVLEKEHAGEGSMPMDTETARLKGLKRPAISKTREDSIGEMENSAKRTRANSSFSGYSSTSGPRNAIDCSFSSSRRWLEKQMTNQQRITRSQSREIESPIKRRGSPEGEASQRKRVTRSSSRSRDDSPRVERHARSSGNVSRLDSTNVEESFSAANTSTPVRDTSASTDQEPKQTNSVSEAGDETPQVESVIKKKLFPLKKASSSKRRQTPIFSPSDSNFTKVPSLRYNLTVEDYAEDREADIQRVQQMLEDVDEPETTIASTGVTSTSVITTTSTPEAVTSTASSISTPTTTSSALAALLDSTTVVTSISTLASPSTSLAKGTHMTLRSATSTQSAGATSTVATVMPSLTKSPASFNLASSGGDITTTTTSAPGLQGSLSTPSVPKLPTFAEATAKTSTTSSATTTTSQFTYKPVFATEGIVKTDGSGGASSSQGGGFINLHTTTTSASATTFGVTGAGAGSTAPTATFSFGPTTKSAAAPTPTSAATSTSVFGQVSDPKASTGGFQFSAEPSKITPAPAFQFNATSSTKAPAPSALPSYSSAMSGATPAASSTFTFGGTTPAPQNGTTNISTTKSFTLNPSGSGITFGSTSSAFGTASTGTTAFGQTAAANAPKTTASSMFTFGATSNQPATFGKTSAPTTSSTTSVFGQISSTSSSTPVFGQPTTQNAPVFGQTTSSSTTAGIFGAPKKDQAPQQSATFQFGASSTQPSSSAFTFNANSSKQTTAPSTFNFSASKPTNGQTAFGSSTTFGQTNASTFGGAPNQPSAPFGQPAKPSAFGQSSTQNAFGQPSSQAAFGQKTSGPGMFGQQPAPSQGGFTSGAPSPFGSQSTGQSGFGKAGGSQNVFGASSNTTFGAPSTQPQSGKGFDFAAAASGSSKPSTGFNFSSSGGGFGTSQTPAGGSAVTFGSPAPASNPFNTAPGTPQNTNMFSQGSGSSAPRPRAVARTARRRTTKR